MSTKGMIIDGILASEAIDSSGEVLDIAGLDISSLEAQDGVLNYEHQSSEDKGVHGQEIVGRIVYVKKIFSLKDCDNDRQRDYWNDLKLPYLYGICRLLDGAGHEGAKGIAAQIRDAQANGEKILARYSIEGTTMSKDGNRLATAIARRAAITLRPCNRTAVSGLVEDPNAPDGFEKKPAKEAEDILSALTEKHEHPNYAKLGGSVETRCSLIDEDDTDLLKSLVKIKALTALAKATEAGCPSGAPSSLSGGACLQREDLGQKQKVHQLWKDQAMGAWHEYDKKSEVFDKTEFRAFLKHKLPEVDDSFVDRFADLIDDYKVKVGALKKSKDLAPAPEGADTSFDFNPGGETVDVKPVKPKIAPKPQPRLTKRGKLVPQKAGQKHIFFDEKTGILHTPRGSLPMYIPSRDKTPGMKEAFHTIMNDPKVNEVHDRAMEGWTQVHKMLKEGKLPPEVIMHATLFSQLSPNTPVPVQELMYAHLVDSMKAAGIDARNPGFSTLRQDWEKRDSPHTLPEHTRSHFENMGEGIRLGNTSFKKDKMGNDFLLDSSGNKIVQRNKGEIMSFMLASNKFDNTEQYHQYHDFMTDLVKRHGTDGRGMINELMQGKAAGERHYSNRLRRIKMNQEDPGPYKGIVVPGLKQKTGRYMAGMAGAGNVFVPDTHMVRYLFGLERDVDGPSIDYLKNALWSPGANTTAALEGIDRYFLKHHDGAQHMLASKHGSTFADDPEQAIFPAFWKTWCAIVPHERARGYNTDGFNEGTDHRPYWDAIRPFMSKSELSSAYTPYQTAHLHQHWAQQYGEVPALMMYYAHLLPHLLRHSEEHAQDTVMKSEVLAMKLSKALAEVKKELGKGTAVGGGQKYEIIAEHPTSYVGKGKEGVVRLPKSKKGTHFDVKMPADEAPEPVVDSAVHGISGLSDTPEQKQLIHGLNLKYHDVDHPGMTSNWIDNVITGKSLFLRGDSMEKGWNGAKREVAYYNAARDVFGLHQYLPLSAAFKHPSSDLDVAAVEPVPMAEHMSMDNAYRVNGPHAYVLKHLGDSGELAKLAVMDTVFGHSRTARHLQFTFASSPNMRLVDNHHQDGLALNQGPRMDPAYMQHYGYISRTPWQAEPLHPAAHEWLKNLDFQNLETSLMKSGMPYRQASEATRRLIEMKTHAKKFGTTTTMGSLIMSPWATL